MRLRTIGLTIACVAIAGVAPYASDAAKYIKHRYHHVYGAYYPDISPFNPNGAGHCQGTVTRDHQGISESGSADKFICMQTAADVAAYGPDYYGQRGWSPGPRDLAASLYMTHPQARTVAYEPPVRRRVRVKTIVVQ